MECGARLRYVWLRMGRQKQVGETDTHTSLRRCLSTLQMTAIGLGSTIGVGIYVLLGVAIRDYAGPGVVLSFLLAGLVVLLNAVVFAEFGSSIPQSGATYTYTYAAIGELAAFLTGWVDLFALMCTSATGARGWSGFIDSLFNNSIQSYFDDKVGQLDLGPPFARSLDWMAFTFFLVLTVVVSCNIQCSSLINTVLAVLTTGVLVFVTFAGFIVGDLHRLADPAKGGFLPYGFEGVITGASAAFFIFEGYFYIGYSAEEARDPVKSVPRAIMLELLIVTVVYCGTAVGILCLIPYTEIDRRAPIPSAFAYQGITWARYIVTIAPVIAMTNVSLVGLYAQSRVFYRMAQDDLLFKIFAYVSPVNEVPVLAVVVSGIMVAVLSLLFDLKDLVNIIMLSMLLKSTVLAPGLLNLRAAGLERAASPKPDLKTNTDHDWDDERTACVRQDSLSKLESGQTSRLDVCSQRHAGRSIIEEEENESFVTDDSPGQTPIQTPQTSAADYCFTDGGLGFGTQPENHQTVEFPNTSSAKSVSFLGYTSSTKGVPSSDYTPPTESTENGNTILTDVDRDTQSESSHGEDLTLLPSLRNCHWDSTSGELADESHFSDESPQTGNEIVPDTGTPVFEGNVGCFDTTMEGLLKILTTSRCLILLMLLLAVLSLQLVLAWEDLWRLKLGAIVSVTVIVIMVIFLCEVLRERCGPGRHEGFKVPCVPYLPVLSCFLNMLLLVTAADYLGIIELAVLVASGLVVYVIMLMKQWSQEKTVLVVPSTDSAEYWSLLAHEHSTHSYGLMTSLPEESSAQ